LDFEYLVRYKVNIIKLSYLLASLLGLSSQNLYYIGEDPGLSLIINFELIFDIINSLFKIWKFINNLVCAKATKILWYSNIYDALEMH